MPPNYNLPSLLPPSSPIQSLPTSSWMNWFPSSGFSLISTSRTTHDISSCNVADFSFAAPYNNVSASMATPAPTHTPTLIEITTSVQPSTVVPEPSTTEPIMATPSLPTTVGEVLLVTTKASKCKSMKSNTHLKTVSAKRQKREDIVVLSTESSQPIEGGRGKQQHF
ncbi:uncharacterized protein HD556DRAFT_1437976 [Suillus plorans]|uniref:Uncharacterized protein n=1 Tax=Suillus plorans TaxID=116603 RepID=A0A9P7DU64_9AGAM|nr:uncharacterized protein HD556DRAFT_1437976 [Suillus plorans]KAG1802915.1 hypothetical protein HD556DRAFT_1437976 [Suillus plorans]